MYKILENNVIFKISDNKFIPVAPDNSDYQQFVDDIYERGLGIVEGADYVGVTTYTEARAAEYPPIADQLDKIYHNGIDAWKADIKVIKDKYPKTQVGITSIAPIPDWVNTALFDKHKEKYIEAKARLAQYVLSEGVKDSNYVENGEYVIRPLPLYVDGRGRNPLIIQDEMEREAAHRIISLTPQSVIDSINN